MPMAINGRPRGLGLVSGTGSVTVQNLALQGSVGSLSKCGAPMPRWLHLWHCGEFDRLLMGAVAIPHVGTCIWLPTPPHIEYDA